MLSLYIYWKNYLYDQIDKYMCLSVNGEILMLRNIDFIRNA